MIIRGFEVEAFRNLRSMTLAPGPSGMTAIIGGNGSGKSNLLEAVLSILMDLYFGKVPSFDFMMEYDTQGRSVSIEAKSGRVQINVDREPISLRRFRQRLRDGPAQTYFPERVIVYYSGECRRLRQQVQRYRTHFVRECRKEGKEHYTPLFVAVTNEDARAMLLALAAHGHDALMAKIGIVGLTGVTIRVRSPAQFDANRDEPQLWGTRGGVRAVLAALDNASSNVESKRTPKPSVDEAFVESRVYEFRTQDEKSRLAELGSELARIGLTLYSALELLSSRSMLIDFTFAIERTDSPNPFDFDYLSEGEKQLLAVLGCIHLTGQRHMLALLDEPDTHLNPNWAWEYCSLLGDSLTPQQQASSTLFLTTHDPVLISGLPRQSVLVAKHVEGETLLEHPRHDPRGQGVGNLLASKEFFGLPSSLDKETQKLMDERLKISLKAKLTPADKERLSALNRKLEFVLPGTNGRDPDFVDFLRAKYPRGD